MSSISLGSYFLKVTLSLLSLHLLSLGVNAETHTIRFDNQCVSSFDVLYSITYKLRFLDAASEVYVYRTYLFIISLAYHIPQWALLIYPITLSVSRAKNTNCCNPAPSSPKRHRPLHRWSIHSYGSLLGRHCVLANRQLLAQWRGLYARWNELGKPYVPWLW